MRVRSYAGAYLSSGGLVRGRSTWFPTPYRRLRPAPHPGDGENGSPAIIPTAQGDCDYGFVGAKLPTLVGDPDTTLSAAGPGYSDCHRSADPVPGEMRVPRWVRVCDVGRVTNAKTAGSQLRGGIVMGIGMALTEETLVDPRGSAVS